MEKNFYTIEQDRNVFIVSNKFYCSLVTVIRFMDGNVLMFSAGSGGYEEALKQQEVRHAYENAKKQGLNAF